MEINKFFHTSTQPIYGYRIFLQAASTGTTEGTKPFPHLSPKILFVDYGLIFGKTLNKGQGKKQN